MKTNIFFCIITSMFIAGCTNSFDDQNFIKDGETGSTKYRIEATMESESRVGMGDELVDGKFPLHWQTGDQIIINGVSVSDPLDALFDGEKSAFFVTSVKPEYPLTVIYPGSMKLDAGSILIPTQQTLLQEKLANGNGILIGYTVDEQDPLKVSHACAYVKVSLTGSATLKKVILMATAGERLSGTFTYNGETRTITGIAPADKGSAEEMEKKIDDNTPNYSPAECSSFVSIATDKTLSATATDLIFAVPAGTYSKGFTLSVVDAEGKSMTKRMGSTSGVTLAAGYIMEMTPLAYAGERPHGIYTAADWITFATDTNHSAWSADGKTVNIYEDIDLSSYEEVPLASVCHNYTLNGNKHTISGIKRTGNAKYNGLLFCLVDAGSCVKDLTLGSTSGDEADSRLTVETTTTTNNTVFAAPFCIALSGDLENCINKASLDLKVGGEGFSINAGGITAGNRNTSYAVGDMTNCENHGEINLSSGDATSYKTFRIGGICGRAISTEIVGCKNSGKIVINPAKELEYCQVGGIVGVTPSGETIKLQGCHNSGEITATLSVAHKNYAYIGGVIGVGQHNVTDCHNTGEVSATVGKHTYIGGVMGYLSDDNSYIISSCTNRGHVLLSTVYSGYNFMGGICGLTTSESATEKANKIENCTNYGFVEFQNKGRIRGGGISGSTCIMDGNTNYGTVQYTNTTGRKSSHIGGIAGTFGHTFTNCSNYGDVTVAAANSIVAAGGFAGLGVKRNSAFYGCKVDCTVTGFTGTIESEGDSYDYSVGLLFGSNLTRKVTLGSSDNPCKIAGKVVRDGTEIAVASQEDITSANVSGGGSGAITLTYATYEATKPSTIE